VAGAIAETADEVYYDELDPAQQETARHIFLRLVQIGEEGSPETRRRADFGELVHRPGDEPLVQAVLNRLAYARLVIVEDRAVELAHEVLISAWPALRGWLDADREGLLLHHRLGRAAEGWEHLKRDPSELYRGARLAQALSWAAAHPGEISQSEQAFLAASETQARQEEAEREAQRDRELASARALAETQRLAAVQLRRRAVFLTAAVVIALLMAGAALLLGEIARRSAVTAQSQGRIAYARELAAASLSNLGIDPERSVLLALNAISTTRTVDGSVLPEATEALHRAILGSQVRLTLTGHHARVVSGVFSPDGKRLATIGQDGTAILWDTGNGKELLRMPGTTVPWDDFGYQMIDFSRDGKYLVTGDRNSVKVWDAGSGALLRTMDGHTSDVRAVAFSPDGRLIASGSLDPLVNIWDAATGRALLTLPDNPDTVQNLAFSPDGRRLAYGTGHTVKLWDTQTGQLSRTRDFSDPIDSVAYSPDGKRLVVCMSNGLQVWDAGLAGDHEALAIQDTMGSVTFSPDGTQLAAISGSTAKLWDAATGRQLMVLPGHTGWVIDVAFSPDGKRLATTSFDQSARIWSITPGQETAIVPGDGLRVAYSPDGKKLLTDAAGGKARLWNAETGAEVLSFAGHGEPVMGVAYSPDGQRVATASADKTAKIWDAATGQLLVTLTGHDIAVRQAAFSPDGKRIITAGFDKTARIWDTATGREQLKLTGHDGIVIGVAFSLDGERVATSSSDHTARIWDAGTGRLLFTLAGHSEVIPAVAFSPDGLKVVTGSQDGTAKVWDARTSKEIQTLTGHSSEIQAVAFSADGRLIATGSGDNTAILWDAATGKALETLPGSLGGVTGVAFDPRRADRLAVASTDGIVRVLLLDVDEQVALAQSRITRPLTTWECQRFLHQATCPTPGK
jgi:WD40 repeat protein